jgi:hypothetical protein
MFAIIIIFTEKFWSDDILKQFKNDNTIFFAVSSKRSEDFEKFIEVYNIQKEHIFIGEPIFTDIPIFNTARALNDSNLCNHCNSFNTSKQTDINVGYSYARILFHNMCGFELVKNSGISFDRVIKLSSELRPEMPFYIENINFDEISIPYDPKYCYNQKNIWKNQLRYCWIDKWILSYHYAIGSMHSMSIYCNIYNNLIEYYNKYGIDLENLESCIYKHLKIESINVKSDSLFDYKIQKISNSYRHKHRGLVAMMITGRICGCWKHGLENTLDLIISDLKPTIFVSTYARNEQDIEELKEFSNAYGIPFTPEHFNIKTFVNDPKENIWFSKTIPTNVLYRLGSKFFHNYECFQLVKSYSEANNIQFNYVLNWRSDIVPFTKLPIDSFNCRHDELVVPLNMSYFYLGKDISNRVGAQDIITIGTIISMSVYCNIHVNLIDFYHRYSINLENGEYAIYKHLYFSGISWSYTKDYISYILDRLYHPVYKKSKILQEYNEFVS